MRKNHENKHVHVNTGVFVFQQNEQIGSHMFTHTVIYRLLGPFTVKQQRQYQRFSENNQNIMLFTAFLAFYLFLTL